MHTLAVLSHLGPRFASILHHYGRVRKCAKLPRRRPLVLSTRYCMLHVRCCEYCERESILVLPSMLGYAVYCYCRTCSLLRSHSSSCSVMASCLSRYCRSTRSTFPFECQTIDERSPSLAHVPFDVHVYYLILSATSALKVLGNVDHSVSSGATYSSSLFLLCLMLSAAAT